MNNCEHELMSYKTNYLFPILFFKNPRYSLGYVCGFCFDYQQNLNRFIQHLLLNSVLTTKSNFFFQNQKINAYESKSFTRITNRKIEKICSQINRSYRYCNEYF